MWPLDSMIAPPVLYCIYIFTSLSSLPQRIFLCSTHFVLLPSSTESGLFRMCLINKWVSSRGETGQWIEQTWSWLWKKLKNLMWWRWIERAYSHEGEYVQIYSDHVELSVSTSIHILIFFNVSRRLILKYVQKTLFPTPRIVQGFSLSVYHQGYN